MSHDICEIYRDICFGNLTIINSQLKLIISIYDKTKQKQTAIFGWLNFFFSTKEPRQAKELRNVNTILLLQ